ncbi:MAG: hypothetical protein U0527_05385 [Candidatus Eisenbacteria bacterium]
MLGDRPWVGAFMMGCFSTAAVALTFLLGRRFFGQAAGLWAAILLATNPWAVLYGRLALPEADSTLLALLAIWVETRGGRPTARRALLVWILSSLAMLANYRWLVLLPLFYLGLQLIAWRSGDRPGLRALLARASLYLLGFVLPLLLTDFIYSAWILGPRLLEATRSRTYFEDLVWNIRKFSEQGWATGLRDPLRFPFFALRFGGPVLLLGLLLGGWEAIRRARSADAECARHARSVLLLATAPPILLLFSVCGFPRCLSIALAPWTILGGLWIEQAASRAPSRRLLLGAAVILPQLAMAPFVYLLHSGYADAAAWLKARGDTHCLASQAYVLRVEGVNAIGIPSSEEKLRELVALGYRYLVVDNQVWTGGQGAVYRRLATHLTPVIEIPHSAGGSATFSYESPERSLAATFAREGGVDWFRPSVIRIYDLGAGR